jgi:hypothetical protein
MKRGGVLFGPKAEKEVGNIWEIQLRSLPVTYTTQRYGIFLKVFRIWILFFTLRL